MLQESLVGARIVRIEIISRGPTIRSRNACDIIQSVIVGVCRFWQRNNAPRSSIPMLSQCTVLRISDGPTIRSRGARDRIETVRLRRIGIWRIYDRPTRTIPMFDQGLGNTCVRIQVRSDRPTISRGGTGDAIETNGVTT